MMFARKTNQTSPTQIIIGNTATYQVEVITNGYYSVDTFFFMSGLLVAYLTFIELEKKRFNLLMFYILRYVRWVLS